MWEFRTMLARFLIADAAASFACKCSQIKTAEGAELKVEQRRGCISQFSVNSDSQQSPNTSQFTMTVKLIKYTKHGNHPKQSTFLTLLLDSKVDDGSLGGGLRGVVGVEQTGGDIEAEVCIVLYLLVTQLQDIHTTCSTCATPLTAILLNFCAATDSACGEMIQCTFKWTWNNIRLVCLLLA